MCKNMSEGKWNLLCFQKLSTAVTHIVAAVISTSSVCTYCLLVCMPLADLALYFSSVSPVHTLSLLLFHTISVCHANASHVQHQRLKYSFLMVQICSLYTAHCICWNTLRGSFPLFINYLGIPSVWYWGLCLFPSFCLHQLQPADCNQIGAVLCLLPLFIETPAPCRFPFYNHSQLCTTKEMCVISSVVCVCACVFLSWEHFLIMKISSIPPLRVPVGICFIVCRWF